MPRDNKHYPMIGIALSGVYAWADGESLRSYDTRLERFYYRLKEGGLVIDKRTCSEDDVLKYVVSGAMVQFSLPDNTKSRIWENPEPCFSYLDAKGMDKVSLNLYLDFWRSLGARIGKRVDNSIVWENGEIEQIVVYED